MEPSHLQPKNIQARYNINSETAWERTRKEALKEILKKPKYKNITQEELKDNFGRVVGLGGAKTGWFPGASESRRNAGDFKDDAWRDIWRSYSSNEGRFNLTEESLKQLSKLQSGKGRLKTESIPRSLAKKLVYTDKNGKKITYDNFENIFYPTTANRNKVYDSHRVINFYRNLRTTDGKN